jgi:hypothetical protein
MVGFDMDARSDRAQLILVGAVAIAFIVLGLAVVFNTVLYTENVASTGAASAPRDAEIQNLEIEFGAKELMSSTNVEGKWLSTTDALTGTDENVSAYSDGLLRAHGKSSGSVVTVERVDPTDGGTEVLGATIQHDGGEFDDASGNENWSVVSSGAAQFGDFNMTIDANSLANEGSDDMFRAVWNASDSENNYTVWIYEDDGPEGNVAIRTFNGSGTIDPVNKFGSESADECILDGTGDAGDRVEFQFSEGLIINHSDCSGQIGVSGGIPSEETRTLSFHRGDSVTGEYDLTVNDETTVGSGVNTPSVITVPIGASDSPYWTHAVWKVTLAVTYDTGQVSFEEEYDIEVYNRSR